MNKFKLLGTRIPRYQKGTGDNGIQFQYSGLQHHEIIEKNENRES